MSAYKNQCMDFCWMENINQIHELTCHFSASIKNTHHHSFFSRLFPLWWWIWSWICRLCTDIGSWSFPPQSPPARELDEVIIVPIGHNWELKRGPVMNKTQALLSQCQWYTIIVFWLDYIFIISDFYRSLFHQWGGGVTFSCNTEKKKS